MYFIIRIHHLFLDTKYRLEAITFFISPSEIQNMKKEKMDYTGASAWVHFSLSNEHV